MYIEFLVEILLSQVSPRNMYQNGSTFNIVISVRKEPEQWLIHVLGFIYVQYLKLYMI